MSNAKDVNAEVEHLYSPLSSVWDGEDSVLIEHMLSFYPRRHPEIILDATVNCGRFWKNSARDVVGIDTDFEHRPSIVADNTQMPFQNDSFDVVIYDPPHIPNQGKDKGKDFNSRFGLVVKSLKANKYTLSHTFPSFLAEAHRVLRPEGILFSKVTDYVHNHRYQWAHVEFITSAQEVGFCACDCIIKIRQHPIIDPRWRVSHHTRRQHCFWLVFRKSNKCE